MRHNLKQLTGQSPPSSVHAHHVFPKALEDKFISAGLHNIHMPQYGAWWNQAAHSANSLAYEQAWRKFLISNPNAGPVQLLRHARDLAKEYGFKINFTCP